MQFRYEVKTGISEPSIKDANVVHLVVTNDQMFYTKTKKSTNNADKWLGTKTRLLEDPKKQRQQNKTKKVPKYSRKHEDTYEAFLFFGSLSPLYFLPVTWPWNES